MGCFALVTALAACGGSDSPQFSDAGVGDAGVGGDAIPLPANAAIYAHTSQSLHRVDPQSLEVSPVGTFTGAAAGNSITDIAIDSAGEMIGVSLTTAYRIDSDTADTTRIGSGVLQSFNGLSYVPSDLAFGVPGPDVLVGIRTLDGKVFQVDTDTGVTTEIGDMGVPYRSSGDILGVTGFGIVATVTGGGNSDLLVRLSPNTFRATPIGTGTGFFDLWGLGLWNGEVYGFSSGGEFVRIDTTTGEGTLVSQYSSGWWGAAVTTVAPLVE